MKMEIDFWSTEKYLPTKRHRKLRECCVKHSCSVDVEEPTDSEFPIAFVVHEYQSVYKDAKSYDDFNGAGDYRMFAEEIRVYHDRLFQPVRVTHGTAISLHFESLDYIKRVLEEWRPCWKGGEDFTEKSIVKESNREEIKKSMQERAKKYVIFHGVVWEACGEPMYEIVTFGLGHNHGGTGFFITYCYNPNISNKNYFNALEREQAIAYGKRIAANRGDTESIEGMGKHAKIEVLLPEMVKRNPQKEHGDGDSFLNSLEGSIESSESTAEAGLLCIAEVMKELKR